MRCYSDIEVRAITEQRVPSVRLEPSVHLKESGAASPIRPYTLDELSLTAHSEMPEMIQFIADLEFESKFAALLHSITLRCPSF